MEAFGMCLAINFNDSQNYQWNPTLSHPVSEFQILIKSCSIESRSNPSPKSEVVHETKFGLKISYSTHACLAQLDQHQTD